MKVVDSPPSEKKASAASYLVDRPSPDIVPWKFLVAARDKFEDKPSVLKRANGDAGVLR